MAVSYTHLQMPIGAESSFRGIIDLVTMKQHMYTNDNGTDIQVSEIDEQFKAKAEEMHLAMLEAVADYDDELMMKAVSYTHLVLPLEK